MAVCATNNTEAIFYVQFLWKYQQTGNIAEVREGEQFFLHRTLLSICLFYSKKSKMYLSILFQMWQ